MSTTCLYVTSPYAQAKLERLAREAGISPRKYVSDFLETLFIRATSRAQKGNTNPKSAKGLCKGKFCMRG